MSISMIVAMAKNRVIGLNNKMPWHLPEDLFHFKQITSGKTVVMGRKTFESIGKALPNRKNIVITNQIDYVAPNIITVSSFEQVLNSEPLDSELIIIGGGQLYLDLLPITTKLYLTLIDLEVDGDTFFPDWELFGRWKELSNIQGISKNSLKYRFITLQKQK